jgi:gas vesicle protein
MAKIKAKEIIMVDSRHSKEFLIGAALGSVLGTASALLMAPKTGKGFGQNLYDTYCDFANSSGRKRNKTWFNDVSNFTSNWKDQAKNKLEDVQEGVSEWLEDEDSTRDLIVGGLAGSIIGAVAGLLLAPKPGSELRQDIADKYEDLAEKTHDFTDQFTRRGRSKRSQTSNWVDLAQEFLDRFSEGKEELVDQISTKGKRAVERQSDYIHDLMDWASLGMRVWQTFKKRG